VTCDRTLNRQDAKDAKKQMTEPSTDGTDEHRKSKDALVTSADVKGFDLSWRPWRLGG
jgi:hypothetical protein